MSLRRVETHFRRAPQRQTVVDSVAMTVFIAARRAAAQPGVLMYTAFFHVMVTLALSSVWRSAVNASGGQIAGYTAASITWYVAFAEAGIVTIKNRLIADIGESIEGGVVQIEMLRPASVVGQRIAAELGTVLIRVAVCVISGSLLSLAIVGRPPSVAAATVGLLSLVLAVTCNLCLQHAFASIAFLLRNTGSTWFLYSKFVFVLGGMLIPLELLPSGVEQVARVLPFAAMAYAPARFAAGHVDWWLLPIQLGWTIVAMALALAAFSAGERRIVSGRT